MKYLVHSAPDISHDEMIQARDILWDSLPDTATYDEFVLQNDCRIKAFMFGDYLLSMLTDGARRQLQFMKKDYTVHDEDGNEFVDGPTLLWCIAFLVKPYNDYSVQELLSTLRSLRATNFDNSMKKLFVSWSNTMIEIDNLGDDICNKTHYHDFWAAATSLDETVYSSWIETKYSNYMGLSIHQRPTLNSIIQDISRQQTNMES